MSEPTVLDRRIGLGALVVYGVGDILGAGIYALIGKAAAEMGNAIWLAFTASMVAASLTGLSYAALGSRYPKAGGASYFVHRAFGKNYLAYLVGLAALSSGITSMAAGSRAFAGYFVKFVPVIPVSAVVVVFCLLIAFIVIRGIRESMWMNLLCTAIELGGLLLIIAFGLRFLGSVDYFDAHTQLNPSGDLSIPLILSGAVLTFYSFIGFEDIINVAEEVKNPSVNIPKAVIFSVVISSIVYVVISLISVSAVSSVQLGQSSAPLVDVVAVVAPWFPSVAFGVIAMFAVANTALLNFIMGSRLLYGMSSQGLVFKSFSNLGKRKTPLTASLIMLLFMLVLAFVGDISTLARSTSVLLLLCFVFVNTSLLVIKVKKNNSEPTPYFDVPAVVPALGIVVCIAMLSFSKIEETIIAGVIVVLISLVYLIRKNHINLKKIFKD